MSLFTRFSSGWQIAKNSFKVLKANRQLIIFPILSGAAMVLIMGSFFTVLFGIAGWDADNIDNANNALTYIGIFAYYIVSYFVIVFFNMALIHCSSLYFKGEEVTVRKGIDFSMSRIGTIFAWAVFAGSVGAILKIIQENVGTLGKILTGLVGIVWGIATFFVIRIIAYENLGPVAALKRSTQLMKEKWGEGIGAGFSFGLIQLVGFIAIGFISVLLGTTIHLFAGIALFVLGLLLMATVLSAARTIFVSAIYHNVTGDPIETYNQAFVDNLFVEKKSKGLF
jgi:hypothetical protein